MRARVLWVIFAVSSAGYAVVVLALWGEAGFGANGAVWGLVMVPFFPLCGAYLMWRRPNNKIGGLLMLAGVSTMVIPTALELATVAQYRQSGAQEWMWSPIAASQILTMAGAILFSLVLVVLPDGELRYKRERVFSRASWAVVALPVLAIFSNTSVIKPDISFSGVGEIHNPLTWEPLIAYGATLASLASAGYLVFGIGVLLLALRYRQAPSRQRKQIRWVLYAGGLAVLASLLPYLLGELEVIPPMEHDMLSLVLSLPFLLLPASVVVAVLEPGWVDVDIVIRRSFVYGALSAMIFLLYVGVAGALGLAAGSRLRIEIAIFLTVIVAVAFQPLRRWLQKLADRLVFGERPTKFAALTELSATIESEEDPLALLPRLVDTLAKTLRLTWVRVLLDDGSSASHGVVGEPALVVPIVNGPDRIGVIECGARREGSLDEEDLQLIHTLAAQVALAVTNARLAGRIVNAAEVERRRIERNIHDGAQQELVALVARLGLAKTHADNGGVTAEELAELQDEARRILRDLRDLAQGIHPSVLTDGGIVEAVEERCARLPVAVRIHAPPSLRRLRFPDEVEGAAYFFVTESLANALKHSGASSVDVALTLDEAGLLLSVSDDGCGFDPDTSAGTGLSSLRDRISALGGQVAFQTAPDSGTKVTAMLPVA